jgi:ADP-heptose:LPS heptosyltransferase
VSVSHPAPAQALSDEPTIVILRALPGLGDWLCAVPTLRALRAARPRAKVHLVGLEPTRQLVRRFGRYVDVFHPFPGWPGLPERRPAVRAIPGFLDRIQALEADLAIQLHGAGSITNELIELFGARAVAGFYRAGDRCPDPARFLRWHEEDPEYRRGLRLLGLLGIDATDERLELPLDPAAEATTADLLTEAGVDGPFIVVHPGGARHTNRWAPHNFATVGASLAASGRRIVVTGSPAECHLGAQVVAGIPGAVDLVGRTDLDGLGWLLRRADLLLTNDTGVSHVASALRVPSVVVFTEPGEAHRRRWSPLDGKRHRAVSPSVPQVLSEANRFMRVLQAAS